MDLVGLGELAGVYRPSIIVIQEKAKTRVPFFEKKVAVIGTI